MPPTFFAEKKMWRRFFIEINHFRKTLAVNAAGRDQNKVLIFGLRTKKIGWKCCPQDLNSNLN